MPVGPNAPYTSLDGNLILQRSFEESDDRLRVDAQVSVTLGTVECIISAASGDNIAITNQDGTNPLEINNDGSINVNVVSTTVPALKVVYNEVLGVINGITTTLYSFTPALASKIVRIDISGTNIATYELLMNAAVIGKKFTSLGGPLSTEFVLDGLLIPSGNNLTLDVTHYRPDPGDFNITILYTE